MVDLIDITRAIEPLVASVEAFGSATARGDRARLLSQIDAQLDRVGVADERCRAALEELYQQTSAGAIGAAEAEETPLTVRTNESAAVEMLHRCVTSLQGYLLDTSPVDDPEAHRLLRKAVNTVTGYVAGYQNLRDQLIKFDAECASNRGVLHARPVKGKVDYAELSREHIARYPKIRARLAE